MAEETPKPAKSRRPGDRRLPPRTGPGSAMWYVLGLLLLLALAQAFFFPLQSGETIPYSTFKQYVREGKVQDVAVAEDRVHGTLKTGDKPRPFSAVRIDDP